MSEAGTIIHWLFFFLIIGGFLLLFLNRPTQTAQLMTTATNTYGSVATTIKNFSAA